MELCLSDNLRLLRQKQGYSLEALAEIISVSRQTAAKWESGDSVPDLQNCMKLATLYKLSLDELVNKPLSDALLNNFSGENDKICGIVDMDTEGRIKIPPSVMDMFGITPSGRLLLLADRRQGIALVKCSLFDEEQP